MLDVRTADHNAPAGFVVGQAVPLSARASLDAYCCVFAMASLSGTLMVSPCWILQKSAAMEPVGKMSERKSACASDSPAGTLIGPTPHASKGHMQILGLPAWVSAKEERVAEQPSGRMAALATGVVAPFAEEALAAGNRERHNHTVADLKLGVIRADLDHLAHGLVTDDSPFQE